LQLWRNNNTHKYSSEHRRLSLLQSSLRTYRVGSAAAAQSMCKEKMCAGDALQTEPVQNARAATYFAKSTNSGGDGNHFDWVVFVALFKARAVKRRRNGCSRVRDTMCVVI